MTCHSQVLHKIQGCVHESHVAKSLRHEQKHQAHQTNSACCSVGGTETETYATGQAVHMPAAQINYPIWSEPSLKRWQRQTTHLEGAESCVADH